MGYMVMNLGFILFDYFPFGGLQRDCVKIARLCADHGHEVTILARTWAGDRPAGIQVELLGRKGVTNISRNRHFLRQLRTLLPRRGFQGIVGFNKLPGLDVYYGADPCYVARIKRLKPSWYRWLPRFRHFAALERAVYAQGAGTQILLLRANEVPVYQQIYRTEAERFHILPPGIARRSFTREQQQEARKRVRRAQGWPSEDRLLLFVGSGFRIKGLDRAIQSLGALPKAAGTSVRLAIIGQHAPGRFANLARRLGVADRVHFLGGRHDVSDFTLAADLLVHPAYSENTGTILLEALAAGLPVLTTDVCGYACHVAKAGAGVVLPSPFQQEDCNRALCEMLTSHSASTWRANGLAYAAREDLYSCHERAASIIEETVRSK
jgi:UDP-glucose:(heptosyl)LPS alpha-1,3-glucosyltransferase